MPQMKNPLLNYIRSIIPRRLPTGMTAFNTWVAGIIAASGLPDNDSTRRLAAQFIFHVPNQVNYLSYRHIGNQLVKAAAYQVASQVEKDTRQGDGQQVKTT
jgi:hypothetical protein